MPAASRGRVVLVQGAVLVLLATLVVQLARVQLLQHGDYARAAAQTSVKLLYQQAPRGYILDRNGVVLAASRTSLAVTADLESLPRRPGEVERLVGDLARLLGRSADEVRRRLLDPSLPRYAVRVIAEEIPKDTAIALLEQRERFPGISVQELSVRSYPLGTRAAHVLGHLGEVDERELAASPREYRLGDQIGKLGVERAYEPLLRGDPGVREVLVDKFGRRVALVGQWGASRGLDAVLAIDANLQAAAEDALRQALQAARGRGGGYRAPGGAVVALDPRNGEVLAMASYPTFDPNLFTGRVSPEAVAALSAPDAHSPLLNRAIAEAVPPGSTFKPVTALAGWDAGIVSPSWSIVDRGSWRVGNRLFRNWNRRGTGRVDLRKSLVLSVDTYYYALAVELYRARGQVGELLQEVARSFGLGSRTGIDLPGERPGFVPDEAWKRRRGGADARWYPGDSANLAIGQGWLQVTPLQLAVAYAALANGGTVWRPHVLRCFVRLAQLPAPGSVDLCQEGLVPDQAAPRALGQVRAPAEALRFVLGALAEVPRAGTAARAFRGFPFDRLTVAGKTGTAQVPPRQPFSWFAAIAPVEDPRIVVVAMAEEAGYGAQVAAPVVRAVLEAYALGRPPGRLAAGSRAD